MIKTRKEKLLFSFFIILFFLIYIPLVNPQTLSVAINQVATPVVTTTAVELSWSTNIPADSQIEYGPTQALGLWTNQSSSTDSNLKTKHRRVISGLAPNTLYYYRLNSRDSSGNSATMEGSVRTLNGSVYYAGPVHTLGISRGQGTLADPWDLQTALCGGRSYEFRPANPYEGFPQCAATPAMVKPGDTIYVLGGQYRGNFIIDQTLGTLNAPVIFRNYNNQTVILDQNLIDNKGGSRSNLAVLSPYNWIWGFYFTSTFSGDDRTIVGYSSSANMTGILTRGESVELKAGYVRLINPVVFDTGGGVIGLKEFSQVYGLLSFNNGLETREELLGRGLSLFNEDNTTPASITASIILYKNSLSEREASSGENSTSSTLFLAYLTASTAICRISSCDLRSLCSM